MPDTKKTLITELLSNLGVKNKSGLSRILGTTPSTITELVQGRGGKTAVNSYILINELTKALSPAKKRKAVSNAVRQYNTTKQPRLNRFES